MSSPPHIFSVECGNFKHRIVPHSSINNTNINASLVFHFFLLIYIYTVVPFFVFIKNLMLARKIVVGRILTTNNFPTA
jgi:hypothetical protein